MNEVTPLDRLRCGHDRLYERTSDQQAVAYAMMAYLSLLPTKLGFTAAMRKLDEDEQYDVDTLIGDIQGCDLKTMDLQALCRTFAFFADAMGGAPDLSLLWRPPRDKGSS